MTWVLPFCQICLTKVCNGDLLGRIKQLCYGIARLLRQRDLVFPRIEPANGIFSARLVVLLQRISQGIGKTISTLFRVLRPKVWGQSWISSCLMAYSAGIMMLQLGPVVHTGMQSQYSAVQPLIYL
ncbi:hypothetical protein GGI43DRAFT_412677 [Trichoderma evansii]